MLLRFRIAIVLLAAALPLRAQDAPIHMRPEFPLVFPLTTTGKDNSDVTVKYPVLINPVTVLKPGMVLRVIYVMSSASGDSGDLVLAHKGSLEQAFARNAFAGTPDDQKLPPDVAHEIEGYRRTVWQVPNNFVLAMAQYPTDTMHLIYSTTGKGRDLDDERFSFFDGLFVGQPDGKVTVIAVEKGSAADHAGIKAGDDIVSVGGIPTQDDLPTFAAAYSTAKQVAHENEVDTYSMTIRPGGKGETQTVAIALPPRIKSALMDDFLNEDKPKKQEPLPSGTTP